MLRVQARGQRVPGVPRQGPAVQRAWTRGQHARDHGRRAVRAHALREALIGRAPHRSRIGSGGGGSGGREARAGDRAAPAPRPASGERRDHDVRHQKEGAAAACARTSGGGGGRARRSPGRGARRPRVLLRGGQVPPGREELLRAARARRQLWRRAARVYPHHRARRAHLWRLVGHLQLLRLPGQDLADVALSRRPVLHALRLFDAGRQGVGRRDGRGAAEGAAARVPLLRQGATRKLHGCQVAQGRRAARLQRQQRLCAGAAARGPLLPLALPRLAALGAPGHGHEHDFLAPRGEGAADARRGCRRKAFRWRRGHRGGV